MTVWPASVPQTSWPLWLSTVDRGKMGDLGVGMIASASISSAKAPRPVPRTMPDAGRARPARPDGLGGFLNVVPLVVSHGAWGSGLGSQRSGDERAATAIGRAEDTAWDAAGGHARLSSPGPRATDRFRAGGAAGRSGGRGGAT